MKYTDENFERYIYTQHWSEKKLWFLNLEKAEQYTLPASPSRNFLGPFWLSSESFSANYNRTEGPRSCDCRVTVCYMYEPLLDPLLLTSLPMSKLFMAFWNMSWLKMSFTRDWVGASRVHFSMGPEGADLVFILIYSTIQ